MEYDKVLQFKWKGNGAKSQDTAHVQWTYILMFMALTI